MVYANAARKTGGFMVLSLVLSLAVITLFSGTLETPTARAVSELEAPTDAGLLLPFVLGVAVGALIIGTYFYIVHLEAKR